MKVASRTLSRVIALLLPLLILKADGAQPSPTLSAGNQPSLPAPIDPQQVRDQDDMTWADYHPIPGSRWVDASINPTFTNISIALVVADFEDQPFVITLPKKSDLFGNPQMDPIKRDEVAKFYVDFWNKPIDINHGHTVNEYWMELSYGKVGVTFDAYGPYRMPKKMIEYPEAASGGTGGGRRGGGARSGTVTNQTAASTATGGANPGTATNASAANMTSRGGGGGRGGLVGDLDALWRPESGDKRYNLVLRVYAGYDETSVWQEFGEMKFQTREDITPEWGTPDPTQPRWSRTRYVDWTSWKAASYLWSNSSIINGECSGSIRHEISHAAFRIGDNNNNPYIQPYHRAGSGPWDVMDRGSFNGPGGPHRRWLVPVTEGGAMPAGLMLRQLLNFKFIEKTDTLQLNRNGLAKSGLAVATVMAREIKHSGDSLTGVTVTLDGDEPRDRTPTEDPNTHPLYSGPGYDYYSIEVVQRIGYDSFCPDSGVLIAKNAETPGPIGGANSFSCFTWVIDAHPEDINRTDFKRPNGEVVMRTIADYRQLNDAPFHAGLNSGSQYEWEDAPNRLHFYVVDGSRDTQGILSYKVGVRSLDGSGPQQRGVTLTSPASMAFTQANLPFMFKLTNTGASAPTEGSLHRMDANAYLNSDIYRLSVTVEGQGWSAQLQNALSAVKFGDVSSIPVFVSHQPGSSASATVTLKARSESDPTKSATASCSVTAQ